MRGGGISYAMGGGGGGAAPPRLCWIRGCSCDCRKAIVGKGEGGGPKNLRLPYVLISPHNFCD